MFDHKLLRFSWRGWENFFRINSLLFSAWEFSDISALSSLRAREVKEPFIWVVFVVKLETALCVKKSWGKKSLKFLEQIQMIALAHLKQNISGRIVLLITRSQCIKRG